MSGKHDAAYWRAYRARKKSGVISTPATPTPLTAPATPALIACNASSPASPALHATLPTLPDLPPIDSEAAALWLDDPSPAPLAASSPSIPASPSSLVQPDPAPLSPLAPACTSLQHVQGIIQPSSPSSSLPDQVKNQGVKGEPEENRNATPLQRLDAGKTDSAAKAGSAVFAHARGPMVAGSPKFYDLLPLDAVPGDVFDRCCIRLSRGDNWIDIAKDEGIGHRELWHRCGKYAHLNQEAAPRWQAAQHAETSNHKRDASIIHARALQAGFDGVKRKKRTKTDAAGKIETEETEEHYSDPAMIRIALETADPATYGRGAGRQAPVTVNTTNAAFFGGAAPVGSLDDFKPAGLPE